MRQLLIIIALLISINSLAQKDKDRSLFFGVNLGTKIANKNYAMRYNGSYGGSQFAPTQLEATLLNNLNNYETIRDLLGGLAFYIPYQDAYSQNIRYIPGLLTGVTMGYQVSPNLQMSVDGNFNKLKVRDVFSIEVQDPNNNSQAQYQFGEIYAEESRFEARFNIDYVYDGNKARFILGGSGLYTFWRMDQHIATFRGYTMPLFSRNSMNIPNEFNIVRGGGWGLGLNMGVEYRINEKIVSQIMYQPYQAFVDYGVTINRRILIQHDISVRFLWK